MDKPKDLPTASRTNNEHQPVAKAKSKRAKLTRLHYVALILILATAAFVTHYLVKTHGHRFIELYTGRHSATEVDIQRHPNWAKPIELPGLPNLHKVSDDLYRGAQPTAEGMRQLEKLGVRTVINLRSFRSDRREIKGTGLAYEHISMTTWSADDKEVVRFLKIVTDEERTPVFVHCRRGADRTGVMCAVYRIVVQGWSKAEAIEEMTKGGFGFYPGWKSLIEYVSKLDIEDIKRRVGATE
jgi:tyrosine-protein phosphatase SIW14